MAHMIEINPQEVTRFSTVNGGEYSRGRRIADFGYTLNGFRLTGDWDTRPTICWKNNGFVADLEKWLKGETDLKVLYAWGKLYESIKKKGFHYDPNRDRDRVQVAIGRAGDIQFVDGRHRFAICRHLGMTRIPVEVVYLHQDWGFQGLNQILDKTMPSFILQELRNKFDTSVKYYEKLFEQDHFAYALPEMTELKDMDVLEVGCSSFFSSWPLIKSGVRSVLGVERSNDFYRNGQVLVDCLNKGFAGKRLSIRNHTLQNYIQSLGKDNYNAFFSSMLLYWLSNKEVDLLKHSILPKCEKAVCIVRDYERPNQKNDLKLNRPENAEALFREAGFDVSIRHWPLQEDGQGGYFVLLATKR